MGGGSNLLGFCNCLGLDVFLHTGLQPGFDGVGGLQLLYGARMINHLHRSEISKTRRRFLWP